MKQRGHRTIYVHFSEDLYHDIVKNPCRFRKTLEEKIAQYPELFPLDIKQGFHLKELRHSIKLGLSIRRIEVAGVSYTIRPSFVMPYLTGKVSEVEKALFLRKFSVPFWALAYIFGKNAMYWHRLEHSIGSHQLVGTTIRQAKDLPDHLGADEKHTRRQGDKVYIASTCGAGCILGASSVFTFGDTVKIKKEGLCCHLKV